jgi:hypothetical protein
MILRKGKKRATSHRRKRTTSIRQESFHSRYLKEQNGVLQAIQNSTNRRTVKAVLF